MNNKVNMGGSRGGSDPPGKSQLTIGFLRNSGTDLPREAIGLLLKVRVVNLGTTTKLC